MNDTKKILLVEDDEDDRHFFIEALNQIENADLMDVATSGSEALAKLANYPLLPDLIFMDINMPRMSGLECLEAITDSEQLKNIPVVIFCNSAVESKSMTRLGAKAFIRKSDDAETFKKEIEQVINHDL